MHLPLPGLQGTCGLAQVAVFVLLLSGAHCATQNPTPTTTTTTTTTTTKAPSTTTARTPAPTSPDANAPSDPVVHNVTAVDDHTLRVQWSAADGSTQTSYTVSYKKRGDTGTTHVAECQVEFSCDIDVTTAQTLPGVAFDVTVKAVQGTASSGGTTKTGNTKPLAPGAPMLSRRTTSTMHLTGSAPALGTTVFGSYDVHVNPTPTETTSISRTDSDYTVMLEGLVAGKEYTVSVYTVSGEEQSDPSTEKFYSVPPTPGSVSRLVTTPTELTVTWAAPAEGEFDRYEATIAIPGITVPQKRLEVAKDDSKEATFTGLTPGTRYSVSVRTMVSSDLYSEYSTTEMNIKPAVPKNLNIKSSTSESLTVKWAAPGEGSFDKFIAKIQGRSNEQDVSEKDGEDYETTFYNLQAGTEYTVEVMAVSGDQQGQILAKSFTTKPQHPNNLEFDIATSSSITVKWDSSTGPHDGYTIMIEDPDGLETPRNLDKSDTSFTFEGLLPAQQYTIKLSSRLGNLESTQLTESYYTNPKPPTDVRVTAKTTQHVTFTWSPPDQTAIVDGYKYDITKTGSTSIFKTRDITAIQNYTLELVSGTTYVLDVYAIKNGQTGEKSSITFTMVPRKPGDFRSGEVTGRRIVVSWEEPWYVYDGFKVTWKKEGSSDTPQEISKGSTDRNHQIEDLQPSTRYTIVVYTTAGQERSSGAEITVRTNPASVGELVIDNHGTNFITVTWERPNNTGNVNSYRLTISLVTEGIIGTADVQESEPSSYTWNNLTPGKLYTLGIEVIFASQSSEKTTRTQRTRPMAAVTLSADTLSTSSIYTQWTVNQSSWQDEFVITYGVKDGNPVVKTTRATQGRLEYTYNITGLEPGFTYVIALVAKKGSQQSSPKEISKTTMPRPVTSLQAKVTSSTQVTLTWQPNTDSQQNAYRYQYTGTHTNKTMAPWTEVSDPNVDIDELFPGETYRFEVQAVSNDQTSSLKDVTATTKPLPPINLHVNTELTTKSEVEVEWTEDTAKSYITGWNIYTSHTGNTNLKKVGSINNRLEVRRIIQGLVSGKNYTVHVKGVAGEAESISAATVQATAKPVIRLLMDEIIKETTEDTITFQYTESMEGEFDYYRFTLNDTSVDPVIKRKSDTDRKVKFTGLTAGAKYRIVARTVSGSEESDTLVKTITTMPNPPSVGCENEKNEITLIFEPPDSGYVDSYFWFCKSDSCPEDYKDPDKLPAGGGVVRKTVTGLAPFKQYNFGVYSKRFEKNSGTVNKDCKTSEGPPGPVKDFTYTDLKPYEVTLTWKIPDETNGVISEYHISYSGTKERKDLHTRDPFVKNTAPPLEYKVEDLKAGYNYTFQIQAKTKELGAITTLSVMMPITKPGLLLPQDDHKPMAKADKPSHKQIEITLVNPFTNQNGDVTEFSILVTTDISLPNNGIPNNDIHNLNSWAEVKGEKPRPPYLAVKECSDLFKGNNQCWTSARRRKRATTPGARVDFTIGGDGSCSSSNPNTYCNGPLDPETPYYVAVVGYTEYGEYTVGPYSEAIVTGVAPASSSIVPVIVGIIAALLVILVVVIIVVFLMRTGRICKNGTPQAVPLQPTGLHHDPEPRVKESNPVKVKDFPDHVAKMTADSDFRFAEEYEELKYVGKNEPAVAAEIACNRLKNRFTNILPYDHSRVKMLPTDDEEGSDYINANWIPGYHSRREFIATQGPLPSTRDDFWRMIWEYNTRAIIMLTKCVEKGRQRCDHYWPVDSEPMFYGDLQVMILHETKCPDWVVSEFKISKGEQSRRLKHFHYLAWPDMDVPDKPQSLVAFVRLIRSKLKPEGGPIIVHCSAGVGRSGTFIALDHILAHIREHDYVDAYNVVYEMRRNRNIMVQTERQYIFLHRCILCVIENREDDNDMVGAGGMENTAFEDDEGIDVKTDS